ncbi:cupin domain-containing protein [Siphonobacter curvatus]|uniref:Cupin n=1 Tax=Siphonobacter curvatus TaxID=2094562 RepID=A0A2S7IFK2_9BACT|nr:cupin domain-containing protein [Siphonobacter curvatus]PQA53473.1 cupin [Siphonobacter curvatus]
MYPPTRRSFILRLSALAAHRLLSPTLATTSMASSATKPFVIQESEARFGQLYQVLGMELSLKIAGQDTHQQLTMFYGKYHKNDGPPVHVHHGQDEQFYIVEGDFLVQVGEQTYTLHGGDTIFLPREVPHAFLVLSETGKMFFQTSPSGQTEALFKRLSQLPATATLEEIKQVHQKHGVSIVGPRLKN